MNDENGKDFLKCKTKSQLQIFLLNRKNFFNNVQFNDSNKMFSLEVGLFPQSILFLLSKMYTIAFDQKNSCEKGKIFNTTVK